ncbi:hypothetical protein PSACC_00358 [Paramicrosporidium saccamoebae]|uniref:Uncharacterized protein n=1 Tax=Paramicrosporidium saccamoebae TaxID=1246581 RepID=A0A2H9TPZ2_9FUNG|nr:hypothetical protein PSACC_00358 [Paramicrosporidium saccamoebae]
MSSVNIIIISLHLLKVIGTQIPVIDLHCRELICTIRWAIHICQVMGPKFRIHVAWIWVSLFLGAPHFRDATKVQTALLMFSFLWVVFKFTHLVRSKNWPSVKKTFQRIDAIFPKLHHGNTVLPAQDERLVRVFLDCTAAIITVTMAEDFSGKPAVIVGVIILLASLATYRHEATYKKLIVAFAWVFVACQCTVDITSKELWKDFEIGIIAAEAALSHLAGTFKVELVPNIH